MANIKPETIKKIKTTQKIWVSKLTGKLAGIQGISSSCLCNSFCIAMHKLPDTICWNCYAVQGLSFKAGARYHYARNTELLSEDLLTPEQIAELKIKADIFRFETHGDWVNLNSALNEIAIARAYPHTEFSVWTKRTDLLRQLGKMGVKQPKNLHVKVSSPLRDKVLDQSVKQELSAIGWEVTYFTVVSLDYLTRNYTMEQLQLHGDEIITCGGRNCRGCMRCYGNHPYADLLELLKQDVRKAKKLGIKIGEPQPIEEIPMF